MKLSGFGNWPSVDAKLVQFRGVEELATRIRHYPNLIARGNGRSYGDAALNPSATLSTLQHNRLIAFDQDRNLLTCESGVLLSDIIDLFLPRGLFPRVTPGTRFVTVGGMIAADVHGKNHHSSGSFCRHVDSLRLMLGDGSVVSCSRTERPDLFAATCGGMGLTGVIVDASLFLLPVETAWIRKETLRAATLDEVMTLFEESASWSYSIAWIDPIATGVNNGRAIFHRGEHAHRDELPPSQRATPFAVPAKPRFHLPFFLPSRTVNRWTARTFNEAYYRRGRPQKRVVDYESFFYPLDRVRDWNRIYGLSGFTQYQCVLPKNASREGLWRLLAAIAASGCSAWLATLKLLGPANGLMSFPMEGFTLAVDFPVCPRTFSLLSKLDSIVDEYGGRLYLAKDAQWTPERLRNGYPEVDRFEAIRAEYGVDGVFSSLLSQRVGL